ncbi:hypothetical protein LOTGIDRAFT_225179 [Lottia gigantea]|uniref:GDP-fucose protein O-fucosyltransferase 1 n=1 Tax=Lottia gigantea TaxID=225164 RepID=V4ACH1_LOTGI|nr:hypothetical protein LOTGIDRAFT_225179 [Lottia gigantea]ESP01704.1 hypothetical protein LOTGIDRAFT_225179 [Lottia gigantea]
MMIWIIKILYLSTYILADTNNDDIEVDPNGYILYCPCMGRFGNQADQFLGSVAFAEALNRTLVLPHWVEYDSSKPSDQIPFDKYFKVEPLQKYHRVVLMSDFMDKLAPTVWPPGERTVFCYSERHGAPKGNECNAKEGNPFGPFWNHFDVDFDKSELFSPLYYDTSSAHQIQRWKDKYPPSLFPVMAFVGAPAPFPVKKQHLFIQKYLKWSEYIDNKAEDLIRDKIEKPFIGIHLRIGLDFKKACEHIKDTPTMFASAQCMGYRSEKGKPTYDMCYPSVNTIVNDVKELVVKYKAKTVFVATDSRDLIEDMSKVIKDVKFVRQPSPVSSHVDLAILQKSDHFIGNCISTFTAFVKRLRDVEKKETSFWAFKDSSAKKDEL